MKEKVGKEFPEITQTYNGNVLEILGQHIMKSERPDIQNFYDFWETSFYYFYFFALVRVLTNHLTIHAVKRSHLLQAYFTTSGNVRLVDVTTNRNIA